MLNLKNSKTLVIMKTNKLAKRIGAVAMSAVFAGTLLVAGTTALKAHWTRVPCVHMVQAHAFDVIYDAFGNPGGTVPCVHVVPAHPYDIFYY
jgi:hypothetical protein